MEDEYCNAPGCDRPAAKHGQGKCWTHLKQLQRTGKVTEIAPKLSPRQRALEAGIAMLDADSDADYDAKKRAFLAALDALAKEKIASAVRKGLRAARARGVLPGRKPRVNDPDFLAAFDNAGRNINATARALSMAPSTVHKRLTRIRKTGKGEWRALARKARG